MRSKLLALVTAAAVLLAACGNNGATPVTTNGTPTAPLSGLIEIDGSSTVYPITEAVAEEFQAVNRGAQVTVGISGTGGGFKRFCSATESDRTDIQDASRPIKVADEQDALCVPAGVEYVELPIAYDGLAVMVNPANDWATCMTVTELKKLWEPAAQETITRWNQIRAEWPAEPIVLFGPGVDSGTFDYFTEAVVGAAQASRGDFTPSEDDNVLVQGIADEVNALGYFGLAYYAENQERLKLVAIDDEDPSNGDGCILPTAETVKDGTYQPLARPLLIYVSAAAAERPEVNAFVRFYLENAPALVSEVGFIPLTDAVYDLALQRFDERVTGTVFTADMAVGVTLEDLLAAEQD